MLVDLQWQEYDAYPYYFSTDADRAAYGPIIHISYKNLEFLNIKQFV